jgi:CTP synthase (UTP-ammonia lyase)
MDRELTVGVIGDFDPTSITHTTTNAALDHAAVALGLAVIVTWVPTPTLEDGPASLLEPFDALWCSPGSPYRSMEGALAGIRYAREQGRPFFGT